MSPSVSPELALLDLGIDDNDRDVSSKDAETAPLIAYDAHAQEQYSLIQYGVLGRLLTIHTRAGGDVKPDDPRVYINTNAPFSAVVCGVQGGGKSHTIATFLESMLIPDIRIGTLPSPLSALVLHFGEGGHASKPCEAAFVGQSEEPAVLRPSVAVFCSPSAFTKMRAIYANLGGGIRVYPLYFMEDDIDASSLLSMMAVPENGTMPLYMHCVLQVLGELGDEYTFKTFKAALGKKGFDDLQKKALEQRLSLLESFLCTRIRGRLYSVKIQIPIEQPIEGKFGKGRLTIVDLTDHLINASSACSLFEIVLKLFNREDVGTGKVVVLDEAHKYLSETGQAASEGSKRLTERLLSFTRQQRHLAMRIIISTQEPTVVPSSILDLCSMIICHRFSSNGWWQHLSKHVSTDLTGDIFDLVVKLRTGEAIVFCPKAIIAQKRAPLASSEQGLGGSYSQDDGQDWGALPPRRAAPAVVPTPPRPPTPHLQMDFDDASDVDDSVDLSKERSKVASPQLAKGSSMKAEVRIVPGGPAKTGNKAQQYNIHSLDRGYLLIRTRKRITLDGGKSVLAA